MDLKKISTLFNVLTLIFILNFSFTNAQESKPSASKIINTAGPASVSCKAERSKLKSSIKNKKLSTKLNKLITAKDNKTNRVSSFSVKTSKTKEARIKVIINTKSNADKIADKLKTYGARIIKTKGNTAAIEISSDKLAQISNEIDEIKYVREPFKLYPSGKISEGVSLTKTDTFHDSEFKGAGVKIAVIDWGFKGLNEARANGDLPYGVRIVDYSGKGIDTEYYHGTACAEIIHDMAPEAELYLIKLSDEIETTEVIDYCIEEEIDIVSLSMGSFGTGPGDGTGYLDEVFDDARDAGILVVASAGNFGNITEDGVTLGSHWKGYFDNYYDSDIHKFGSGSYGAPYNIIAAYPSQDDDGNPETGEVSVVLRWNDWPYADSDYDIYLYEYDYETGELSEEAVAYSSFYQEGDSPPLESLSIDIPDNEDYLHFYALVVERYSDISNKELEIFLGGTGIFMPMDTSYVAVATSESSITEPADAESVLAVGAVDSLNWETGPQEDFSSQGPTNAWNGSAARIKPDVVAPDGVTTLTYGDSNFMGTSAAAPHVAGLAALILSQKPYLTPDDLQDYIESNAIDMDYPGKDNFYGWGKIKGKINYSIVTSSQKINDTDGNFTGVLDNLDYFGSSVASIGDLDGDGITDIAVGAIGDDDGGTEKGAVWILLMKSDGTVKSHQKISDIEGNFNGELDVLTHFGGSVSSLGDLDGDGITDLAVGTTYDDDGGYKKGAVWILFLKSDGTVRAYQKISDIHGNFTGELDTQDSFGSSISSIGDLDGDGITDIAVGASGDSDSAAGSGAIWILFLNSDGTVKSHQKINMIEGNFNGVLNLRSFFGQSVAAIGDLDGDGIIELAVGGNDDLSYEKGAVWILFMNSDGTVKSNQKISDTEGNFDGELEGYDYFGSSVVSVGDLNGDGAIDIAVGASGVDDAVSSSGGVWILFMNTNGMVKCSQKISMIMGGFSGVLESRDAFGSSITNIGDFNGDGISDLVVGAKGFNVWEKKGAVWLVTLTSFTEDKDSDGMSDPWEIRNGLNPEINDADDDKDSDGYTNINEFKALTDPNDADCDDDGIPDGDEDINNNQVLDSNETDAMNKDTDGDGIQDGTETGVTSGIADPDGTGDLKGTDTSVFIPDSDSSTRSNPVSEDTDGDGLSDGEEDRNFNGAVDYGETNPNDNIPVAIAGPDRSVKANRTVTLDGTDSYSPSGSIVSYSWSQVSGDNVDLSNPDSSQPVFTAPSVNSSLRFLLTVTDNLGRQSSDLCNISVDASSWQLISINKQPEHTETAQVVESVLENVISVWGYEGVKWYVYDPANPDFSDLPNMTPGNGYWIHYRKSSEFTVAGTPSSDSVSLNAGWNLVGYNSDDTQNTSDAIASIADNVISVWAYKDDRWKVYDPENPDFSDLPVMEPGYGYWFNVTGDCEWSH